MFGFTYRIVVFCCYFQHKDPIWMDPTLWNVRVRLLSDGSTTACFYNLPHSFSQPTPFFHWISHLTVVIVNPSLKIYNKKTNVTERLHNAALVHCVWKEKFAQGKVFFNQNSPKPFNQVILFLIQLMKKHVRVVMKFSWFRKSKTDDVVWPIMQTQEITQFESWNLKRRLRISFRRTHILFFRSTQSIYSWKFKMSIIMINISIIHNHNANDMQIKIFNWVIKLRKSKFTSFFRMHVRKIISVFIFSYKIWHENETRFNYI